LRRTAQVEISKGLKVSDAVEVTVEIPEDTPEAVEPVAPVVVVVEDNAPADDPGIIAPVIDHEGRLTVVESQQAQILALLEAQASGIANAQISAEVATEIAVDAHAVAEEAAEGEQAPATDDVAPNNEHWFFR